MTNLNKFDWWLNEADMPNQNQAVPEQQPSAQLQPQQQNPPPEDDVTQDPELPDFDDQQEEEESKKKMSFEEWKHKFLHLSTKSDVGEMLDMIGKIRERPNLEPHNRKFVEDNLQILLYRQEDSVRAATKKIRQLIKEDLDRTNPGTVLMQHIMTVLGEDQSLFQNFIKFSGLFSLKADLHRKFICALLGAVQVGGGGTRPDILYVGPDYTIGISTRCATQFEEINLGKWYLKVNDPEKYLTESELDDLHDGSPDLKQALRRKVQMESIADKFEERAFLVHVIQMDGTVFGLGWDLGDSLTASYKDGKTIIRAKKSEEKNAMITSDGKVVPLENAEILYVRESGETDDNGKPEMIEVPFIEQKDGNLYLSTELKTLQNAASTLTGMFFKEFPYNGNPSEVPAIRNCVPSVSEMINKKCFPS